VEQAHGVFVPTLAVADDAEVRDHLSLVLFVPELPEDDERLLEVLDCHGDPTGVNEREGEIVERESFCSSVTQIPHDRQREAMLLGSLFVLPVASKLRSELVESLRLAVRVGCGRLPLTRLQGATGLVSNAGREPAQTLPGLELVERRP
jgi:hypothetical protein